MKEISTPLRRLRTNKNIKTMKGNSSVEKDFLTVKEAAAYTSYAESYLRKLAMRKQIPYFKISARAIRFSKSDLIAFLSKCRVPAKYEDVNA